MPNFTQTNCVFHCSGSADDSLEHYCRCPVLKRCFKYDPQENAIDKFFAVTKGMSENLVVSSALRLHVTLRLIHYARLNGAEHNDTEWKMLADLEYNKQTLRTAKEGDPDALHMPQKVKG